MQITKIIEGVVDLESGEQHSTGVMVRTALGESFVPLPQESIQRLVELWAQTQMSRDFPSHPSPPQQVVEAQPEVEEDEEFDEPEPQEADESSFEQMFSVSVPPQEPEQPSSSYFPSLMEDGKQIEFQPEPDSPDTEELEVEDDRFSDPVTGVASL